MKKALSKGITTMNDCGIGVADTFMDLGVLMDVVSTNFPMRISGYLISTGWDDWASLGLKPEFQH